MAPEEVGRILGERQIRSRTPVVPAKVDEAPLPRSKGPTSVMCGRKGQVLYPSNPTPEQKARCAK